VACGLVVLGWSAPQVIATDRKQALHHLRRNVAWNREHGTPDAFAGVVHVAELSWCARQVCVRKRLHCAQCGSRGAVVCRGVDCASTLPTPADVVLGSDLVYNRETAALLLDTLCTLLSSSRGTAFLVQDDDCVPGGAATRRWFFDDLAPTRLGVQGTLPRVVTALAHRQRRRYTVLRSLHVQR
jgi:hypothetical protein